MVEGINRIEISVKDFSPRVLKSYLFTQGMDYPEGYKLNSRYIYDYELEFFTESKGSMFIDDKNYEVRKGDIVFRKPGQTTQGIMPYCCYLVCFDLTGKTAKDPDTYDFYNEQEFQDSCVNKIIDAIPPLFHPAAEEAYHRLFEGVLNAYLNRNEYSELVMKTKVLDILCQLYKDIQDSLANRSIPLSSHYTTVKKVIDYIEKNYNKKIDLMKLSEQTELSPNYLHKVFTDTMELTPNEYLTRVRLNKSKEMLVKTNTPIYETAILCGFDNVPYFSYLFKRRMGMTPAEFRRKHSYIG